MTPHCEIAAAKINLALHVRGRRPDGRHDLETIFAFCTDGDRLSAAPADELTLTVTGPFAAQLDDGEDNLVMRAARALRGAASVPSGAALRLEKKLPVASGIGGGSADAAAALRLLASLWRIDPAHASTVAPSLGSDVPACLLSMTARGTGAGDELQLVDAGVAGTPVLLVNPLVPLSTADVFARWDGEDDGPLGDWREGRNGVEPAATALVREIAQILDWLRARAPVARMSGSGATCFGLFDDETALGATAAEVPPHWWHMATTLR